MFWTESLKPGSRRGISVRFLQTFHQSAKAHVFTLVPHHQFPCSLVSYVYCPGISPCALHLARHSKSMSLSKFSAERSHCNYEKLWNISNQKGFSIKILIVTTFLYFIYMALFWVQNSNVWIHQNLNSTKVQIHRILDWIYRNLSNFSKYWIHWTVEFVETLNSTNLCW